MATFTTVRRTLGLATVAALIGAGAIGATSSSAAVALPTITTVASSLNPSVVGDPVTFTATVTKTLGIPLGTVQFFDGSSPLDALPISLSGGAAQFVTSSLPVGTHDITASFVPLLDLTSLLSTSGVLTQVVNTATGGGGGGVGGICVPGVTPPTPTPTISAPSRVVGPKAVTVHGKAAANDPVDLFMKASGASAASKVASVVASASGTYSFARNVSKQTAFAVQDRGACGTTTSGSAVTKVALAVGLIVKSPKKGKLRMSATTAPKAASRLVRFYRAKGGKRVLLAKVATGAKGTAHKTITARSGKRYRIFATVSAPTGNLPGKSKQRAVTVR